ncbi:uncharacterized protein FA14DRAFT_182258 [Meira miltonrushii]|uniref:Uncharacterized protein n=1 Tax=Meira miltonrushii TaxID=1280837 RepID=A0A316V4A3_9BASI|nr:uncharacterized protein FA14DRAFT_182258 [Meira miltonrushii]PWN32350.1 hypothetical protein FA14DRAFT_182258 [Meira miltonrushii]
MDVSESDRDQSVADSSYSEMERFARIAAEEEEEIEMRNAFNTAPTMTDQGFTKSSEFKPAKFVSSRGGIGSSRLGIGASQREPNNNDEDDRALPRAGIGRAGIGSSRGIDAEPSGSAAPRMSSLNQFMPAKDSPKMSNETSTLQQDAPPSSAFSQRASQASKTNTFTGQVPKISFKTGGG